MKGQAVFVKDLIKNYFRYKFTGVVTIHTATYNKSEDNFID
jgi:hypothetical protein